MVSKTRRKAKREMLDEGSDQDENHQTTQNVDVNNQPLLIPTSTTRLDAEDEFVRLCHRIDSEIDKGLSASLLQFESRLEAALESIRQTVTNSLSARSQVCTDHESDADQNCNLTSASKVQCIAGDKFQGGVLDRDVYHASEYGQVTMPNWFDSQTSLGDRVTSETHLTTTHTADETGHHNPMSGALSSLPWLFLLLSMQLCSLLTDVFRNNFGRTTLARKFNQVVGTVLPACFLILTGYAGCDASLAVTYIVLAVFFYGPAYSGYHCNNLDLSQPYAAILYAIANTVAQTSGFIAPIVVQCIIGDEMQAVSLWWIVFSVFAAVGILGTSVFVAFASGESQGFEEYETIL